MKNLPVSVVRSLSVTPVENVARFGQCDSYAVIEMFGPAEEIDFIPGSATSTQDAEDGIIKKRIVFKISEITPERSQQLGDLTRQRLIAFYTDEKGNRRVAGSPDHPLAFSHVQQGSAIECTLAGEAQMINLFLEV